jgi:hypothetical protein
MKKLLFSILLSVAGSGALMSQAAAGPVVAAGSTYTFFIQGIQSGEPLLGTVEFDTAIATVQRGNVTLAVSETEASIGAGKSHISIDIAADGDLFPFTDEGAFLGIGVTDLLDLISQVSLDDARITFFDAANEILLVTDNLAALVPQNNPWTGSFPAPLDTFIVDDVGGIGVSRISFDFMVTEITGEVPEPSGLLLAGIALAAAGYARKRQRKVGVQV